MEDAGLEDEDDFTTPFDHLEETELLLGALRGTFRRLDMHPPHH
jgi:hypothetical protein